MKTTNGTKTDSDKKRKGGGGAKGGKGEKNPSEE